MNRIALALFALTLFPLSAHARVLPSAGIRVAIEGKREPGIGLRNDGRGWRLQLGSGAAQITLTDITAPTHEKWVMNAEGNSVTLDGRFVGGHAYRVEVKKEGAVVERGVVYLYPARGAGKTTHVAFDDSAPSLSDDDGIRIAPKSAL